MNVVGHVRVSGRGQLSGDGPERQEEAISFFCRKHELILIPRSDKKTFFEEAQSGTIDAFERPVFEEMIAFIKSRKDISGFVVESAHRLARKLTVSELLLEECRNQGVQVFTADAGGLVDLANSEDDPMRVLLRQMIGSIAEYQKSELVKKLRVARERIRERTGRCEGRPFYGETAIERRILQAAIQIFNSVNNYDRTAKMLNEAGFTTRYGKPWSRQNVNHIITNHIKHTAPLCD